MLIRFLIASLALTTTATYSDAGPFRRHAQPNYQPSYQPAYQILPSTSSTVVPAGAIIATSAAETGGPVEHAGGFNPVVAASSSTGMGLEPTGMWDGDGLDEVNAKRAARGLRPFIRDENLTQAARACAQFRAAYGQFGHTSNDFAFVPAGTSASSAGCAAYPASYGWMSCCVFDNYTFAGAAWVAGRDGRRYMHLFVR